MIKVLNEKYVTLSAGCKNITQSTAGVVLSQLLSKVKPSKRNVFQTIKRAKR